jgi:hypothetical protein
VAVGPGIKVGEGAAEAVGASVVVGDENTGRGVFVGITLCVLASPVLTVEIAVPMISASLTLGVDWPLPQDASIVARNKRMNVLPKLYILPFLLKFVSWFSDSDLIK